VQCRQLGSTCPAAYRVGRYKEDPLLTYEGESLLAMDYYAASDVPACNTGEAEGYTTPVRRADGTLVGCVYSSTDYCPAAYRFEFLTVTSATGGYTLDCCYPTGGFTECQAPSPLLSYSTPGYLQSTLSACIKSAAGPGAGVKHCCPNILPVVRTQSVHLLQVPPSATNDIIKGCVGDTLGPRVNPVTILCDRDVAGYPFTLISASIPDVSSPVTFVSAAAAWSREPPTYRQPAFVCGLIYLCVRFPLHVTCLLA
jgi:hypothetical protein